MVLDVHGTVPGAARRGDQEVGLAYPPSGGIGGQAPAQDERRAGLHRAERGVLPLGPVLTRNRVRPGVHNEKPGDDICLELPASREPALEHRRIRAGLGRPDEIPLGSDRAPLGYITALRWHSRRVVAGAHRPMVLGAYDIPAKRHATYADLIPAYFQAATGQIVCASYGNTG